MDFKGKCSSSWIHKETLFVYHEKYTLHANIHKEQVKFLQDCAMVQVKSASGCPSVTGTNVILLSVEAKVRGDCYVHAYVRFTAFHMTGSSFSIRYPTHPQTTTTCARSK